MAMRRLSGKQSRRAAWGLHLLTYMVTSQGLPLQWEEINSVGVSPPARFRHASAAIDSVQGALFVFGG
jgi:hypothetical protein